MRRTATCAIPRRKPRAHLVRRSFVPVLVTLAVVLTMTVGVRPAAAVTAKTADRTTLGAYVVGQLANADSYEPFGPGFPDVGLSTDAVLALTAAGGHDATVARLTDFAAGQVASYGDPTNAGGGFSGGSIGKLALVAEATGRDPRAFGGSDLIAALSANVCTPQQVTADPASCPAAGLYRGVASTFSQSLGLIAQARDGGAPAAATAALLGAQCANGSFPSVLPATGPCTTTTGDVDSTSMAAQALSAVGGHSAAVDTAVAWIAARQEADGGFPGTSGDNTNSAALAIQALTLHASTYAARIGRAQAFLAARQNRTDGGLGINPTADGKASDVRASTQGLSGVVGTPFATVTRAVDTGAIPPGEPAAAARGAGYLTSAAVLTKGNHVESGGFVDYGLTADIAIALASAGGHDARLTAIVSYLRQHVAAYADPAGTVPGFPGPFSGGLAKLALVAEITGQNPHSFGGYDLLGVLRARQCAKANTAGTCTAKGDFFQAFSGVSQALGVLALARAGTVKADDPAVVRLRQLQCPDGGFSSTLPPATPCVPDVDTTGFALQALALVHDDRTASTSPAADALLRGQDYVLAARRSDGSYPGASGNNTNSTALAVQALLAVAGQRPASASSSSSASSAVPSAADARSPFGPAIAGALSFLTGEQNRDGGFGINAAATSSDARASAQVVPALMLSRLDTQRHPITLAPFVASTPTPPTTAPTTAKSTVSQSTVATRTGVPTSSAIVATGASSVPTLANTGVDRAALDGELLLALLLCSSGAAMIALGRRRASGGRHR